MEKKNKVKEKYEKPKLKAHRINLFFLACCTTTQSAVQATKNSGSCCKTKKPNLFFSY